MKPDLELMPDVVAPPSPGEFPSGIRGLRFGLLDASDLAQRALGIRNTVPDEQDQEEAPFPQKFAPYSFAAWATDDTLIYLKSGDIWMGSMCVIHWTDILNATNTPLVSATDTCVWLVVNQLIPESSYGSLGAGYAEMVVGPRTGEGVGMEGYLDATARLTKLIVPLVETTWTDGVITDVKELHPGDVFIPRAAG